MKIRRFFATDMRSALRQVRSAHGAEAVILSSRACEGGVEIISAIDYDEALVRQAASEEAGQDEDELAWVAAAVDAAAPPPPGTASAAVPVASATGGDMQAQLDAVRDLFEVELTRLRRDLLGRREPRRGLGTRELERLGLTPEAALVLSQRLPPRLETRHAPALAARVLAEALPIAPQDPALEGGILAIVGTTGVGKTTTIAKLAARCARRHGADSLALISTDAYRIGAHDQLATYARILGVPIRRTETAEQLRQALRAFDGRRLILIDSPGVGHRDRELAARLQLLATASGRLRIQLALSASADGPVLRETIRAFRGRALDAAIITKLDEAVSLGPILSELLRAKLPISYLTNGQRVPEDLLRASRHNVLLQAVRLARPAADEATSRRAGGAASR